MKQRLAIALAIMHDPEILILDEPINGLDPIGIAEMRKLLRNLCDEKKKTILISSHILPEIQLLADDIGIIDNGILLVEESLKELEEKNHRYMGFHISDVSQGARILEDTFNSSNFDINSEGKICLYDMDISIAKIIRCFTENGLDVFDAHIYENTLEDYFKEVTGGAGIA